MRRWMREGMGQVKPCMSVDDGFCTVTAMVRVRRGCPGNDGIECAFILLLAMLCRVQGVCPPAHAVTIATMGNLNLWQKPVRIDARDHTIA